MADEKGSVEGEKKDTTAAAATATGNGKKKRQGFFSRIWNGIFRLRRDDFEKRLQYISKEEAAVLTRMNKRSLTWRRWTRHLIIVSVIVEVIAVCYAIMTTRTVDMNWKMRAIRVLPMFLLPGISSAVYSAYRSIIKMCDSRDQKTLEKLRAERQAKIDELKEKTNYYTTQQLIQRYDTDPAAKAAAASVLASKLGADSGMKVYVGDESKLTAPTGKSNDVKLVQSSGLRNRKQIDSKSSSVETTPLIHSDQEPQGSTAQDGGWIARIAALLVGEDPTQSYALICGNCHMHNGLARKEDFPYITYYCPHCHALNKPKLMEEWASGTNSPNLGSVKAAGIGGEVVNSASGSASESIITSNSPLNTGPENEHASERVASGDIPS
ncbi:Lunapark domain containing protein [Quillaja saponaria]|uniref:Lunapark domain containing protein n=1 Tax=Quillaja saponaria TaxID=32244 RepID=A0AAD7QH35_QUISA|nr:Lunapark domain containing protein [Quillaja saponaria]